MSKIKQLLQLHSEGMSNRRIAKELDINKGTVNVRKVKDNNIDIESLVNLDDPVLEGRFMAGTAADTDKRFEEFKELFPYTRC